MTHDKDEAPEDETPTSDQASGVSGEQLSFLPTPVFCPILPPANSDAALALDDLLKGDVTQIDWLQAGKSWRLAAAIKVLDYLGWCPRSIFVKCEGRSRKIARYSLPEKAKQAAYGMRGSAASA